MNREQLPEHWSNRLKAYLVEKGVSDRDYLLAYDFGGNQAVRISLRDGSVVFFNYAFYILDRDLNEIAVFTEHCGYHVFPLSEARIEVFKSIWTDVGN
jgi:hypothetical protein